MQATPILSACTDVRSLPGQGCTVPQIAMAWIYGQSLNTFAVVSSTKPERMQSNIDALDIALTEDELLYLDLKRDSLL